MQPANMYAQPQPSSWPDQPGATPNVQPVVVREKNFPPCRPVMRHDISQDIPPDAQAFMFRMFLGWWAHIICLEWNFISMMISLFSAYGTGIIFAIFYSVASAILGPAISFVVYWLLYSGMSNQSAFKMAIWMGLFVLRCLAELWFFIGIPQYGCSGIYWMAEAFSAGAMSAGFVVMMSTIFWFLMLIFDVLHFVLARRYYARLGGMAAARQGAAQLTGRGIRHVVVNNKEMVQQVVVENREVITQSAFAVAQQQVAMHQQQQQLQQQQQQQQLQQQPQQQPSYVVAAPAGTNPFAAPAGSSPTPAFATAPTPAFATAPTSAVAAPLAPYPTAAPTAFQPAPAPYPTAAPTAPPAASTNPFDEPGAAPAFL
eukprot:TRINITY_DN871_c0_g1_i1.p1 TRINITY_DN871_c0_g1~~TRINITY_DN871_c0_g1_i1.p1  ORF type:complete len:371 (-),score=116.06 TRINITY_DN871_c0_g1_i1:226-1338(-)